MAGCRDARLLPGSPGRSGAKHAILSSQKLVGPSCRRPWGLTYLHGLVRRAWSWRSRAGEGEQATPQTPYPMPRSGSGSTRQEAAYIRRDEVRGQSCRPPLDVATAAAPPPEGPPTATTTRRILALVFFVSPSPVLSPPSSSARRKARWSRPRLHMLGRKLRWEGRRLRKVTGRLQAR